MRRHADVGWCWHAWRDDSDSGMDTIPAFAHILFSRRGVIVAFKEDIGEEDGILYLMMKK